MLSQGVTPPAQAKPDGPQLPNQATKGSVRFMQANLDVIGPEMAMGDPVSAFWFASRCAPAAPDQPESPSAPMTPGGPPGPARVAAKTIRQILPTPVRFGQSWLSVARPGSGGDGPKRLRIPDPLPRLGRLGSGDRLGPTGEAANGAPRYNTTPFPSVLEIMPVEVSCQASSAA